MDKVLLESVMKLKFGKYPVLDLRVDWPMLTSGKSTPLLALTWEAELS